MTLYDVVIVQNLTFFSSSEVLVSSEINPQPLKRAPRFDAIATRWHVSQKMTYRKRFCEMYTRCITRTECAGTLQK